ncbi:DUF4124 domain-containing protein [Lysobacter koreensis]|uniref:DUF4124 domain-containing protein n=2 Tax=Lysobacter koreensis TaxID=266122 RepID=A0ABW2YL11_9GAMM
MLAWPTAGALAQHKVVIYRCTDASGALTVQNDVPCAKGSKQDKRVIEAAPSVATPPAFVTARPVAPVMPMPAANPPAPAGVSEAPVATIADADRLPPPALFECRTYDNDRYLHDDGNPPQRCAPMQTTGLGGSADGGAGAACQMVDDSCQRVADGALCESWQQRLRELESALRFGQVDDRATAQAQVERIGRIVRESTCGK